MPEVIISDEISTELQARIAQTIAERGVQFKLIGTTHTNALDNFVKNLKKFNLLGAIQVVNERLEIPFKRLTWMMKTQNSTRD
jgi:stage III sporulation protein SpoIIIAA